MLLRCYECDVFPLWVSWCGPRPVRWAAHGTCAELESNTGTCSCVHTFLGKSMITLSLLISQQTLFDVFVTCYNKGTSEKASARVCKHLHSTHVFLLLFFFLPVCDRLKVITYFFSLISFQHSLFYYLPKAEAPTIYNVWKILYVILIKGAVCNIERPPLPSRWTALAIETLIRLRLLRSAEPVFPSWERGRRNRAGLFRCKAHFWARKIYTKACNKEPNEIRCVALLNFTLWNRMYVLSDLETLKNYRPDL